MPEYRNRDYVNSQRRSPAATTRVITRVDRYRDAYRAMAKFYRPQAGGRARLGNREATEYAVRFRNEEDTCTFAIGCSDFATNKAFCWTIEAARCLAGCANDEAVKLLRMAEAEIERSR